MGSRSQSSESFSVSEFQQNLSMLEQDWQQPLGTPSSITSSLFDVCHCCGKQDCENLEYMKKLESDTRLAAEIGQSLLLKHETFVTKSNEQRIELEKQLEESHQRLSGLEQLLDEVENQKILNETLSDLEIVNEKYNQLSIELDEKTAELEKLRVFKFMVRNAELREETLTSKLDDTKQELSLCRKNELVLESKIKKLKMRYGTFFIFLFYYNIHSVTHI
ncbi:hypothetical protein BD770DRAFT_417241 [Pilaira anomala]|nr:hypothetical protein BD770DRAFT_417241 [Pilaira anomala]